MLSQEQQHLFRKMGLWDGDPSILGKGRRSWTSSLCSHRQGPFPLFFTVKRNRDLPKGTCIIIIFLSCLIIVWSFSPRMKFLLPILNYGHPKLQMVNSCTTCRNIAPKEGHFCVVQVVSNYPNGDLPRLPQVMDGVPVPSQPVAFGFVSGPTRDLWGNWCLSSRVLVSGFQKWGPTGRWLPSSLPQALGGVQLRLA